MKNTSRTHNVLVQVGHLVMRFDPKLNNLSLVEYCNSEAEVKGAKKKAKNSQNLITTKVYIPVPIPLGSKRKAVL